MLGHKMAGRQDRFGRHLDRGHALGRKACHGAAGSVGVVAGSRVGSGAAGRGIVSGRGVDTGSTSMIRFGRPMSTDVTSPPGGSEPTPRPQARASR